MSDDEWAYLRDGFNSRNLRKEDLRRIFATHNVPYTNDMLKPQLLELYHSAIVPRRAELRQQFVDVVPSGLNIVDAGSASESDAPSADAQPPRSPRRLRPRVRSPSPPPPRRQRSPRRVASGGKAKPQPAQQPAAQPAQPTQQPPQALEDVPNLAPESEPKPPPSPRAARAAARSPRSPRCHANRKVELPGLDAEPQAPPKEVPLADIKIKAPPRSPRRRRGSSDDDDSFSNENVFQPSRKRASHGPESAAKRSAKASAKPSSASTSTGKPVPKTESPLAAPLPVAEPVQDFQAPANPSPDAVLLDEALVDALNAEVQWEQEQDQQSQHAADLRMMLDLVASDPDIVRSATEDVVADLNSEFGGRQDELRIAEPALDEEPEMYIAQPDEVPSSDILEGSASELSKPPSERPSRLPSESPNRTPAPGRRRGFIPSFAELSVSRAFTEQLEPYMAASPATTPRPQQQHRPHGDEAIPVPRPESKSPSPAQAAKPAKNQTKPAKQAKQVSQPAKETQEAATSSPALSPPQQTPDAEVVDPEAGAAHALHDVIEAPNPRLPRFRLPRPRLPRPRLPHIHLPRPRFPRFRLPRPRLPRIPRPYVRLHRPRLPHIRLPRLHLPALHLPRPRLPNVQLPRLRVPRPRIPRPHLPRVHIPRPHISVPKPRLPTISFTAVLARLLQSVLGIVAVIAVLSAGTAVIWYRDVLSKAEFCGVGTTAPHTYPDWTLVETSSEALSTLQTTVRDAMDAVWPECIPCPAHAQCYQGRILLCKSGYREAMSSFAYGGLWPAPPRCLPDYEVQRKLEVLGERAAQVLRQRRADALCNGGDPDSALAAEELTAMLRAQKAPQLSDEEFDLLWKQVLHRLPERYADVEAVRHVDSPYLHETGPELTMQTADNGRVRNGARDATAGSIEVSEDEAATTYLRSRSDALIPLGCRIRLYLVDWIHENRKLLFQIALAVVAVTTTAVEGWQWVARRRRLQKSVHSALTKLQDQSAQADVGAVRQRYVKTLEFRKGVPKHEWPDLQRLVESEQGVRVRQIEINGEITRVWEWTG